MVERFAARFNSGDFHAVTEDFVFPLPIQLDKQLVVLHNASQMAAALASYQLVNAAQSLTPSTPQIIAVEIPRNGRFRLWVDWVYGQGPKKDQTRTKNLYFCSAIGNRVQIEMVQYLRVAATGPMVQAVLTERLIA
jgi:hypothetical protein